MASPTEKWCCEAVRQHFENRGERGVFIYAEPPHPPVTGQPSYWLAVNAIDQVNIPRIPKPADGASLPIMLQTWLPVRFCPWCGRRLVRFYRKHWKQLFDKDVSVQHGWAT
jgi:hypothetical protein